MAPVLFGQSYYLRFDPKLQRALQPYPPLGTLYAASYLRDRNYEVALFDAMLADSEQEWAAALDRHRPRFAVIYEDNFNYLSKMCLLRMRQAAFEMIGMAKMRLATVIVCGADATDHPLKYLARGADYVLLGEGEETLGELMDFLNNRANRKLTDILGLAWSDGAGGTRRTPRRPDITDLDQLPFPAWDLVDVPRYQQLWRGKHGYYSVNMVTTRGCPYHCNWCAKPIWGQRYQSRSPENVVAELRWLKHSFQPDHVSFADDIFGLKPGWIERFGDLVKQQDAAIPFKCLSRADMVSPPVIAGLKSSKCKSVWLGAESGSQKILDAMEKGTTVEQIHDARRRLGEAGIEVGFFLQFGYPGETRADVERTLEMVRNLLPDDIGISVSYPLPGTKFHDRVKAQLGDKQNWVDSEDLAMLYEGGFPPDFYRVLHRTAHHEFRMRRAQCRIKHGVLDPPSLRPHHLRTIASVPYHWLSWKLYRRRLDSFEESARPGAIALGTR